MNKSNFLTITMIFRYLFLFSLICASISVYGQRKETIYITFDTKTWDISESDKLNIPFDQPFIIKGSFGDDSEVNSIKLKYKLLNHCKEDTSETNKNCLYYYKKRKHYYFYNAEDKLRLEEDDYVHLDPVTLKGAIKKFEIPVGPLHDNENYEFYFEVTEKKDITPDEQKELKKEIVVEINKTYDFRKDKLPNNHFAKLKDNIKNVIEDNLNGIEFYYQDSTRIDFSNPFNSDEIEKVDQILNKAHEELYDLNNALSKYKNYGVEYVQMKGLIDGLVNNGQLIKSSIDKVLDDAHFKEFLSEPINPLISKTVTLSNILNFISSDINRWKYYPIPNNLDSTKSNRYLVEVLLGRAKIKDKYIEATESHDLVSGLYLWSAFNFLQNATYKNDTEVLPFEQIKPIYENIEKWNYNVQIFDNLKKQLVNQSDHMADLFNDLYANKNARINFSTIELLKTRDSKYLGLDFGVMFAPEISSTFVFEGFNFYLRPVNKDVSLKNIKGWDRVFKRISFSFGIAQRVGNAYDDNYEQLVGVGSPFVGMGFRLNKNLRFSSGTIFYESTNFNPLITETQVKSTYFFALSLDVSFQDIIKTLSGIK